MVSSKSSNAHDKEEEIIQLEEKLLELKKENRALKSQLIESSSGDRIKRDSDNKEAERLMQETIEEKELKIVELSNKVQELTDKNQAIEEKFNTALAAEKHEHEKLLAQHSTEQTELNELRAELERKTSELQANQQQDNSKESNTNNGEMIRSIMNQFYTKLFQSIEGKSTLSSADVLKLTAEIIRKETKAALNSS